MNERKELVLTYARRRGTFYEKNFEKLLLDKVIFLLGNFLSKTI